MRMVIRVMSQYLSVKFSLKALVLSSFVRWLNVTATIQGPKSVE